MGGLAGARGLAAVLEEAAEESDHADRADDDEDEAKSGQRHRGGNDNGGKEIVQYLLLESNLHRDGDDGVGVDVVVVGAVVVVAVVVDGEASQLRRLAGITGVGGMGTAQEPRAVRICTGSAETTSFYIARHAVITLDWVFSVLTGELNLSHGSWPGCGGRLDWYTRGSPVWSTGRGVSLGTRKGFGHTLKWAKRPGRIQGRRSALKKPRWEPPSPSASEKGLWDSPETHGGAKLQAHGGSRTLPSKGPGRWTGQTEDQFWIDLRPSPDRFWIGRLTVSFGGDSHPITGSGWTTLRISSPLGSPMRALRLHCSASAAERRVNRAAKRARQAPPAQGTRPAPISGAVLRGDQLTPPQMVGVEHINRGDESSACRNVLRGPPRKRHSAFWTRMIPVIHEESDEASDTSSTIDATSSISGFSTLPEILDTVFGALDRGRLPKAS
ncbi:hypothetical protein V497_05674 [Pseudogymnoascus sp. VKM F-4516 (FW-969)]|nr:hypothetical protein V497_05674 [Pseudogymnoascus sp. VKM F-4516 (FW-969)]